MLKTLAWKESRELLPLAVLTIASECLLALMLKFPTPFFLFTRSIPFYADPICRVLLVVAGIAAIVFGLRQTTRESSRGTYQFLLHRPVTREALFGTKLLVGLAVFVIATGLPLAVYTLWAATPGTHASPFLWPLAAAAWLTWALLPLLYLGGFLSGLRPGRWLGTRLFPLGASVLIVFGIELLGVAAWIALAVGAIAGVAMLLAILNVADTRDYS